MAEDVTEPKLPIEYSERLTKLLKSLPTKLLKDAGTAHAVIDLWRKGVFETLSDTKFLEIWDRTWRVLSTIDRGEEAPDDPVFYAINDPAGKLTEELFKRLWPKNAKVGGGLPSKLTQRIERIIQRTDHATPDASSLIVSSRAEVIFAVDPNFAKKVVFSLFSWKANTSAAAYWTAFLWQARISPDSYKILEEDFLQALKRPDSFRDRSYEVLCQLFLLASMELKAPSPETVNLVMAEIGQLGIEHMSSYIRYRMLHTRKEAPQYWRQTVWPWLKAYWPRDADRQSERTKADFALIAIYSVEQFPAALKVLEENGLLGEAPQETTILYSMQNRENNVHEDFNASAGLPERFPRDVLHLLKIARPFQWDHGYGRSILNRISGSKPELAQTAEYAEIEELLPLH
jgi:hypothetical protein